MSAYRDALTLDATSAPERVRLAADLLHYEQGVVLVDGVLALRSRGSELLAEVIDPMPTQPRAPDGYKDLVKNAQATLRQSPIFALLQMSPSAWLVVEDYGTGTIELWREA